MSEDDSWPLRKVLSIPASVITLLMGADWLWNKSAAITWIANTLWSGLSMHVKFWHLGLIGIVIAGSYYFSYTGKETDRMERDIDIPKWDDYTEDKIRGVLWRWFWNGKHAVNVTPFCPKCKTEMKVETPRIPLDGSDFESVTECPNCEFRKMWKMENPIEPTARIIERNAREGDYEI